MKNSMQYAFAEKQPSGKPLGQVLLIDDSKDENEYHEVVVNESNLAEGIKSISDSEEALKYLGHCLYSGNNPDLIFLDIMMPRLNGYELLDKYRALMTQENYPQGKIKIFILSGFIDDPEMDFYLNSPGYKDLIIGYRQKPLTVGMLQEIKRDYFGISFSPGVSKTEKPRYKQAQLSMAAYPNPLKD